MENLQDQLKTISRSLSTLSRQVETLSSQLERVLPETGADMPRIISSPRGAGSDTTLLDAVYDVVKRSKHGVSVSRLKERTGLGPRQVSNALYKLHKRGKVETKSRGVYVRKRNG